MNVEKSFDVFKDGLVFGFDVGKGSMGEAVRRGTTFLHKALRSCRTEARRGLVIPAEFWKIKMGLFRLRGSPVWKSSFALRLAAWLFPTIDTARLVLIRSKASNWIS
jgi:hypothetical protein